VQTISHKRQFWLKQNAFVSVTPTRHVGTVQNVGQFIQFCGCVSS